MSAEEPERIGVGIDLGTTYCCIAALQHGNIVSIRNTYGDIATPSYIAFEADGNDIDIQYGRAAKEDERETAVNVIFNVKRLIGRRYNDPVTQEEIKRVPYKIVDVQNHPRVHVDVAGKQEDYLPGQLSGWILSHLLEFTNKLLGKTVTDAVITVPANFNNAQKKATRRAGDMAGLKVLRLINEPTAAAIAYGKHLQGAKIILVFDFGGGTLDVSVLEVKDGKDFTVKATAGDMHLGGEDLDERMAQHLVKEFQKAHGVDITDRPEYMKRARQRCEKAKLSLTNQNMTRITMPALNGKNDLMLKVTRAEFEKMCGDIFRRILGPVKDALAIAELTADKIDQVLLTGGSSRIPRVQELLKDLFPGKLLDMSINPDEAIAHGAAELAQTLIKDSTGLTLVDVTPLGLGVEVNGGILSEIIPKNSALPATHTETYYPVYKNQTAAAIRVHEGDCTMVVDNHFLGSYTLGGLKPNRPSINVTFEIDDSGILYTRAVEEKTGRKVEMVFTDDERYSKEEVKRMKKQIKEKEQQHVQEDINVEIRCQFERALDSVDTDKLDKKGKLGLWTTYNAVYNWHEANRNQVLDQGDYRQKILELAALPKKMA